MMIDLLQRARVLPVLTVREPQAAVQLVDALVQGGMTAVEITLRTSSSLQCLAAVRRAFPKLIVAAGTVVDTRALDAVHALQVNFAVSPGMTALLIHHAQSIGLPLLPGIATASEALRGHELGIACFKLFPAEAVGGRALLKSLAEPLAFATFCPTGGLSDANFRDYLALPNVSCVGGSWMVPADRVAAADWPAITTLAARALG